MVQYLVIMDVQLHANRKVYRKNAILTADLIGQEKIDRYLKRGYIATIGEAQEVEPSDDMLPPNNSNLPYYLTAEDYLDTEQVSKLNKKDTLAYGAHIGVEGLKPAMSVGELRNLIEKFISEAIETDDEEESGNKNDSGNAEGGKEGNE